VTPSDQHIVLVGMMGTGKTTVGEALAARLGRDFADTDQLVELATKQSVRDIFESEGEEEFRRLEGVLLHHALASIEPGVIACGGGAVTTQGSRRLLRNGRGYVVWLRGAPLTLVERLAGSSDRPLLDGDATANLQRLADERAPWYVDVDARPVGSIVDEITGRGGGGSPGRVGGGRPGRVGGA